jgi:lipopolysaccharide export system permease protein
MITFATVFVILFFIFILQTIWLFIAELAGKDLDIFLIIKFLVFSMPRMIPLVLPLSILLASIMTFGTLAENYEFAAMKSSGISLQRAMRSLTVSIAILSVISFLFANNVIPYAEFEFINFRRNIAQRKPALAITAGQFSEIGDYNIKVDKKSGENDRLLSKVTIHKNSLNGVGNKTVIKAKNGELISGTDSNILQLVLYKGYYYEDIIPREYIKQEKVPFVKSYFEKYILSIDLSEFNSGDVNQKSITNANTMLSISELSATIDTLKRDFKDDKNNLNESLLSQTGFSGLSVFNTEDKKPTLKPLPKNLLKLYNTNDKVQILLSANLNLQSAKSSILVTSDILKLKQKDLNKFTLSYYEKLMIAYSCFLMFFIGAPLGAIIKKGGIGLPIVFAVLVFITYHFINTFGKRLAQESGLTPFMGAWISSIILTPLALFLTYRATVDMGKIGFDLLEKPIQNLKNILKIK